MSEVERLAVRAMGGGRPLRLDRVTGPDRTGTAFAVVDAFGRFVDAGLHPGWWASLGPARVAPGLLEALAAARMKAALVPMIARRVSNYPLPIDVIEQHTPGDDERIAAARRTIHLDETSAGRIVTGRQGLFRLHVRGGRVERAEVAGGLTAADTDRLVADAREVLAGR